MQMARCNLYSIVVMSHVVVPSEFVSSAFGMHVVSLCESFGVLFVSSALLNFE